jgi:hypothetical protein
MSGLALGLRGIFHVGSDGFATGLHSDRAHFRAAVVDGRRQAAHAGERRDQDSRHRAWRAELADPRHPDRQLLSQPVRTASAVLLSWVFVASRFVHAGIFVSSNDLGQRSSAWLAGVLVLLVMWIYFAFKILLLI